MIKKNEEFICEYCGKEIAKHPSSARNHCNHCLSSKHLDLNTPGDRLSCCKGHMKAVSVDQSGKKGFVITHKCEKCYKLMKNKVADDDNWDKIIALSHNENYL